MILPIKYFLEGKDNNEYPKGMLDLIFHVSNCVDTIYSQYSNWTKMHEKIKNRIDFYLNNITNLPYIIKTFEITVNKSPSLKEPCEKIENNTSFKIKDSSPLNSLNFALTITNFEVAYMPIITEIADELLNTNTNIWFRVKTTWLKKV